MSEVVLAMELAACYPRWRSWQGGKFASNRWFLIAMGKMKRPRNVRGA